MTKLDYAYQHPEKLRKELNDDNEEYDIPKESIPLIFCPNDFGLPDPDMAYCKLYYETCKECWDEDYIVRPMR